MIQIDTTPINEAMKKSADPLSYLAAISRSTTTTCRKVLQGKDDLNLRSIATFAETLGFDVHITYKKRKEAKAAA